MSQPNVAIVDQPLPEIPRLEDVSETYAALYTKLLDLYRRQTEVQEKIRNWIEAKRDRARTRYSASEPKNEIPNNRVAAILGEAPPPTETVLSLDEQGALLSQEEQDLAAAITVMSQRLVSARMEASRVVCNQIKPQLDALVSELATKMAEVSHLGLRYRQFADQLNAANIAWSHLEVMSIDAGGVSYLRSPFVLWLTAAADRGYVDVARLPKEIR